MNASLPFSKYALPVLMMLTVASALAQEPGEPSQRVAGIVGLQQGNDSAESRSSLLRRLPGNLSRADVAALQAFAQGDVPPEFRLSLWHSTVNDVMDAILRQTSTRREGMAYLVAFHSTSADPVLQDYAIQKFPDAWATATPEDRTAALAVLKTTVKSGTARAGTALVAWQSLTALDSGIDEAALTQAAASVVTADDSAEIARITAIQICAARHHAAILPRIRASAADPAASVALRISATGALGSLGSAEEDGVLLHQLAAEPPFAAAATASLSRLAR